MNNHLPVITLALLLREIINVFICVLFTVLAVLYGGYLYSDREKSMRSTGWRHMTPVSTMITAWFVISLGEVVRSSIVWELIHFEGRRATYLTNILPLLIALGLIIVGGACAIRVITPGVGWRRHWLWGGSVLVAATLSAASILW